MAQTTLTVWRFSSADGARGAGQRVQDLAPERRGALHDAAEVWWEPGAARPRTRQLPAPAGAGALGGAFWGMLFGLLFFVPLLGAAVGAAMGAVTGLLADVGIDDGFVNRVRDAVTPGTSALFLLSTGALLDDVRAVLGVRESPDLIVTGFTGEQEAALREVFGEDDGRADGEGDGRADGEDDGRADGEDGAERAARQDARRDGAHSDAD